MGKPSATKKTSSFQPLANLQDRCWVIPVVAASVTFLISIITSSRGYLFVLYMDRYGVDRETASWADSVYAVTGSLIGFGLALLQAKVSVFSLTMISAAAACAGAVGSAFCQDMVCMSVAIGGVYGAGHGAILTCFGLYSMLYFDKYKATATGAKFAALATSGLAAPAIMSLLVNRYGLSGALLLSGAIAMHAAPLLSKIMLAQPVSVVCPAEPSAHMAGMSAKSAAEMLLLPEFYVLIVAYFVSDWTDAIHGTTVVDYGRDKGAPLESANYLQTYGAIGELLGRIVIPCLSDKVAYGHSLFATGSLLWSSMTLFGMTFSTSYASFASFNALLGASQGYVQCMRSVLVTDYLGLERLPLFYGCVGLLFLPISLGSPNILAIAGFFRETLGSYDNLYRVFGALNILVSLPLFFITCRDKRTKKDWQVDHET